MLVLDILDQVSAQQVSPSSLLVGVKAAALQTCLTGV